MTDIDEYEYNILTGDWYNVIYNLNLPVIIC